MRLPEAKIKEALVHPEKIVRQEALHYFAECFSRDTEVMPLAIRAIEAYGRSNAFLYVHMLADLAQTEATVDWIVRELHKGGDTEDHDVFFPNLSRILCSADPQLLRPRATEITQAPGFAKELRPEFQRRLRLASWDTDRCWKELDAICAKVVSQEDSANVDSGYASEVVEALARHGEQQVERILERLGKDVDDWETEPSLAWMEIFLVELAGEMRLEQAVLLIVRKLRRSEEILSEECVEALCKIGTDAAAEAVTERWLELEWDCRLYATSALDGIHTDTTVKRCLELLPQDKDLDIRTKLADSLLAQFAEEGIGPVTQMVRTREYDASLCDLKGKLVAVSTILGVTFPECPIWKREVEDRREKQEKRTKAMMGYSRLPTSARKPTAAPFREPDELAARKQSPFLRTEKQVGRNDPCPCGSGKKFKKCCMSKGKV